MADGPIGTIIAAVGTLAAVGATAVAIMTYRDGKLEKEAQLSEPTASVTDGAADTTTTSAATTSALTPEMTQTAGTDTTVSAAPRTEQTVSQTSAAPPQRDDTIRADSDFRVKTIAQVHPAAYRYVPSTFFSYDAGKGTLFFLRDTAHIASWSIASGDVQDIADLTGKAEVMGLSVDAQTGNLYAALRRTGNTAYVDLYDCTGDRMVFENIMWEQNDYDSNALSIDRSYVHVFTNRNEYGAYKADAQQEGGHGDTALAKKLPGKTYAAVMPFLHDGSYWSLFLSCDYDRTRYTLDVTKTTKILPSESCELQRIAEFDGFCGISAGADGLCYIDKSRSIRECDPDGERGGESLLSSPQNPDTLLVDGSRIQETAADYLSAKIPLFLRIDNSHFVMYDADDSALKLLYAE